MKLERWAYTVRPEDIRAFLFPLQVSKIPGIGGKTTNPLI